MSAKAVLNVFGLSACHVVEKHHSDLYLALLEVQKEEADVGIKISELSLGKMISGAAPKKNLLSMQQRVQYNRLRIFGI